MGHFGERPNQSDAKMRTIPPLPDYKITLRERSNAVTAQFIKPVTLKNGEAHDVPCMEIFYGPDWKRRRISSARARPNRYVIKTSRQNPPAPYNAKVERSHCELLRRLPVELNQYLRSPDPMQQGVFYGIQSLRSLVPVEFCKTPSFQFPTRSIYEDEPRFRFRDYP